MGNTTFAAVEVAPCRLWSVSDRQRQRLGRWEMDSTAWKTCHIPVRMCAITNILFNYTSHSQDGTRL